MIDGTRDPKSDFVDLRRQCEQLVEELSGGVDADYWSRPLLAIRSLLALVDDQAQQIAALRSHHRLCECPVDGYDGTDCTFRATAIELQASLAAQAREIQELRAAITPTPFPDHKSFVSLAIAHREDSEDVDGYEARTERAEAALVAARPYLQHADECRITECATCKHHEGSHLDFEDGRCHNVVRPFEWERCTCKKFISKGCTCGLAAPPEGLKHDDDKDFTRVDR